MKMKFKYDIIASNGKKLVANSLKDAKVHKRNLKLEGVKAYIVQAKYLTIIQKVVG